MGSLLVMPNGSLVVAGVSGGSPVMMQYRGDVVVRNVAPFLTIAGPATAAEGQPYTLNLSAVDPGQDTLQWTVTWGDRTTFPYAGTNGAMTRTFAPGYAGGNIGASATDDDGGPYVSNGISMSVVSAAPTNLTASVVSPTEVDRAWSDHSAIETGFLVEQATTSSGPWTTVGTTGSNAQGLAVSGLARDTAYYFRVKAVGGACSSGWSNTVTTSDTVGLPVVEAGTYCAIRTNQQFTLAAAIVDLGAGGPHTFAWTVSGPNNFSASGGGQYYSFTPPADGIYIYTATVTFTDRTTMSASETATITATSDTDDRLRIIASGGPCAT